DRIEHGIALAGAGQRSLPLDEARGGRRDAAGLNRRPRAPALLRLVEIATAGGDGDLAGAFEAHAAPKSEAAGVENVAFDGAFMLGPGTDFVDLAGVPGGRVEMSIGRRGK